jgi:hypothetical protein
VEARVPYLDGDLFSFVVNLPSRFKVPLAGNTSKALLRLLAERKYSAEFFRQMPQHKLGLPSAGIACCLIAAKNSAEQIV